jgi:hypothetical protein
MAGTTKSARIATLEDVTRRCSVGIAARATILEDAIHHARQAHSLTSDAEQHFTAAVAVLNAARPVFAGTSDYMQSAARTLSELTSALETDVQELRGVQAAVAGIEEPSGQVLRQILAYSIETIQSRIRGRMSQLGGEFSMTSLPRAEVSIGQVVVPTRRRPESIPPREVTMTEFDESMPTAQLVQVGLDNFERGGELLESSHRALLQGQTAATAAIASLEGLAGKFKELAELESGSNVSALHGTISQLEKLRREVEQQSARLTRIAAAPETARGKLLAILDNMGRLLVAGVVAEGNPAEARDVSVKDVIQQALQGNLEVVEKFLETAEDEQRLAMSDALYHVARTHGVEPALNAIEGLRSIALTGGATRSEAGDNLLSLSNLLSVPESVRSAATAALVDLTNG